MSPRKASAQPVRVTDSDACTAADGEAREPLRTPDGALVTPYPAEPGPPPPPWVAHAHLPQWRDRPGPGA